LKTPHIFFWGGVHGLYKKVEGLFGFFFLLSSDFLSRFGRFSAGGDQKHKKSLPSFFFFFYPGVDVGRNSAISKRGCYSGYWCWLAIGFGFRSSLSAER
jgi:hypothetical protein